MVFIRFGLGIAGYQKTYQICKHLSDKRRLILSVGFAIMMVSNCLKLRKRVINETFNDTWRFILIVPYTVTYPDQWKCGKDRYSNNPLSARRSFNSAAGS